MLMNSRQPRKQRLFRYHAPLHVRQRFVRAHLSKELRKKLGKRSVRIHSGDGVKIIRGSFKGVSGKVTEVDLKKSIVFVDNCKRKKASGKEFLAPLALSKLVVVELSKQSAAKQEQVKSVAVKQAVVKQEPKPVEKK
ncbi:50S ribosomal protein L24 [Candidatus Micrarchaeota archaeon]|nr:50S ribosomal protein L24 [Candidatus Micrarchaeota archaeon]